MELSGSKDVQVPRLLVAAAVLVVGAIGCVLLGLDAAAEMPLSPDRFSALLGSGLGGLALLLTAAGLVAVDGHRRLAARRAQAQGELYDALLEATESVAAPAAAAPRVAAAAPRRRRRAP